MCFDPDFVGGYLGQATLVKGRHGRAEAHFWFLGYMEDGPAGGAEKILYLLLLIGESPAVTPFVPDVWPPMETTLMTMDTWTLSIEGEGATIRDKSCVVSVFKQMEQT